MSHYCKFIVSTARERYLKARLSWFTGTNEKRNRHRALLNRHARKRNADKARANRQAETENVHPRFESHIGQQGFIRSRGEIVVVLKHERVRLLSHRNAGLLASEELVDVGRYDGRC